MAAVVLAVVFVVVVVVVDNVTRYSWLMSFGVNPVNLNQSNYET